MDNSILNSNLKSYDDNATIYGSKDYINSASHSHIEQPIIRDLMKDLRSKDVLCLGCGSGEECKYFSDNGASVHGIDYSFELIEIAKKKYPDLSFEVNDIREFSQKRKYDYIYSGYVLHYFENWDKILKIVYKHLKHNGKFIFSISHPIKKSFTKEKMKKGVECKLGYIINNHGGTNVEGDYLNPHEVEVIFTEDFKINMYNRPISLQIADILKSPFKLEQMIEPKPIKALKFVDEDYYKVSLKIPSILIYVLKK